MTRILSVFIAVASVLVMSAAPASAHARLISTQPSGGQTLDGAPVEIVLEFNEPIEPDFATVQAFAPDGTRVDGGEPIVEGARVRLPLQPVDAAGTYQVAFRVVSVDGHPVESSFPFTLMLAEVTPAPRPAPAPEAEAAVVEELPPVQLETAGPVAGAGLWVLRLANYLALTIVVGLLLAAAWLLAERWPEGLDAADASERRLGEMDRRATRAAAAVSLLWAGTGLGLFVLGLSNAAARPVGEVLAPDMLGRFTGTRFGAAVLAQAGVALLVAILAIVARTKTAAAVALAAAALGGLAPAWWGHAGTSGLRYLTVVNDWAHVLAATTWVGGLAVVALLVLSGGARDSLRPAVRFSRLAGWALGVVLATGLVNSVVHLGSPANLLGTSWGRLVLVKLALLGGIAGLGWVNRRRCMPLLEQGGDGAAQRFRRVALAEVGLMVLAFGTATGLASGVPAEAEAAGRIQSIATAFGDGQVNLTLDPAATGDNVLHLYFFDPNAQLRDVTDAAVVLGSPREEVNAELFGSGPGHYTGLAVPIPAPGTYNVEVSGQIAGSPARATGVITVR
ncbi:MAG: copper resistance CopC/CopD family protein [Egibacteraceae bacterium]